MGSFISSLLKGLLDYPLKEKPVCFLLQENFTSTGEPLDKEEVKEINTHYDYLSDMFFSRLSIERQKSKPYREMQYESVVKSQMEKFPGWTEVTVSNIQGMLPLFDFYRNGYIDFESFCSLMQSIGIDKAESELKETFVTADTDMDGWLDYNECLLVIYTYDPPDEEGNLQGVAKRCQDIANHIEFVSKLSIAEEIEYGII